MGVRDSYLARRGDVDEEQVGRGASVELSDSRERIGNE